MFRRKKRELTDEQLQEVRTKDFFDCIAPGAVRFFPDYYIAGGSYRCMWAIREYPPATEAQAILAQLGDRSGVTLRMYHRPVEPAEARSIIRNATRKNKLMSGNNDVTSAIEAEGNLQDVVTMLSNMRTNRETLIHTAVFLELRARTYEALGTLQSDVNMELTRAKLSADRLRLRQREGFLSVLPFGANQFGAQFERVLPASSVANLYPFSFSGKTDPQGLYIGRDKFGSTVVVDFDHRCDDKTNANTLILGNSGQGKSYLMKLLLCNLRESGKHILVLDPEAEYRDLTQNLGGCYLDLLSGQYIINPLEPKLWNDGGNEEGTAPEAFRRTARLSQHIAFLKDFFRVCCSRSRKRSRISDGSRCGASKATMTRRAQQAYLALLCRFICTIESSRNFVVYAELATQ